MVRLSRWLADFVPFNFIGYVDGKEHFLHAVAVDLLVVRTCKACAGMIVITLGALHWRIVVVAFVSCCLLTGLLWLHW